MGDCPEKWLLSSNKCYWPTHKNVEELARKNTRPDERSWSLWHVKKIAELSGE